MNFRAASPWVTAAMLSLVTATVTAQTNSWGRSDPLGRLMVERGWAPAPQPSAEDAVQALVAAAGSRDSGGSKAAGAPAPDANNPALSLTQRLRGRTADLVTSALQLMGVPYRNGGVSAKTGFDCSGFTRHVFERIGIDLPRLSREQAHVPSMTSVKRKDLQPGDLVFFNTVSSAFSHVGIYLGDYKFIHAPRTGGRVRVEDIRVSYWQNRFDVGRRVIVGEPEPQPEVSVSEASVQAIGEPWEATALR